MTKIKTIPENICEYLKYDETSPTGLRWIKLFGNTRNRKIGEEAGCLDNNNGYYDTKFNGIQYKNHRIIFFLHHGYCPDCLDHIDCNRTNNKIDNLREATHPDNMRNRKLMKHNTSGYIGVIFQKDRGKYRAISRIKPKKHLGEFETAEEAARVYDKHLRTNFPSEFNVYNFPDDN